MTENHIIFVIVATVATVLACFSTAGAMLAVKILRTPPSDRKPEFRTDSDRALQGVAWGFAGFAMLSVMITVGSVIGMVS